MNIININIINIYFQYFSIYLKIKDKLIIMKDILLIFTNDFYNKFNLQKVVNLCRCRKIPIYWINTDNKLNNIDINYLVKNDIDLVFNDFLEESHGKWEKKILKNKEIKNIYYFGLIDKNIINKSIFINSKYNLYYIDIDTNISIVNNNIISIEDFKNKITTVGTKDSFILYDFLKEPLDFDTIDKSINWNTMLHNGNNVPRLISIQAKYLDDGSIPIYRHPVDKSPKTEKFNNIVEQLCKQISKELKVEFNHVLIQKYRNGEDFIGEHSDKTLDIKHNTPIVNFTVGATRCMTLKNKITKEKEFIELKNNSLFILGPETNQKYYHLIKKDKRIDKIKSEDELLNNSQRISFTFRCIDTYIKNNKLYGQGAPKNKEEYNDSQELLYAFSTQNKESKIDWNILYGKGFYSIDIN